MNDIIKELFRVVFGNVDFMLEKRLVGCWCCVVVGNLGNLREFFYGFEIDRYDFVFRMNKVFMVGFEVDVGMKIIYYLVYFESFWELGDNVSMILVFFKIVDLEWVVSVIIMGIIFYIYVLVFVKIRVK